MANKLFILFSIFGLLSILSILIFKYLFCNRDVEDFMINGHINDQNTMQSLDSVSLNIENWIYQGGDHDGFNGVENITLFTDSTGYFSKKIKRGAYIVVFTNKSGYKKDTIECEDKVLVNLDIFLIPLARNAPD